MSNGPYPPQGGPGYPPPGGPGGYPPQGGPGYPPPGGQPGPHGGPPPGPGGWGPPPPGGGGNKGVIIAVVVLLVVAIGVVLTLWLTGVFGGSKSSANTVASSNYSSENSVAPNEDFPTTSSGGYSANSTTATTSGGYSGGYGNSTAATTTTSGYGTVSQAYVQGRWCNNSNGWVSYTGNQINLPNGNTGQRVIGTFTLTGSSLAIRGPNGGGITATLQYVDENRMNFTYAGQTEAVHRC